MPQKKGQRKAIKSLTAVLGVNFATSLVFRAAGHRNNERVGLKFKEKNVKFGYDKSHFENNLVDRQIVVVML